MMMMMMIVKDGWCVWGRREEKFSRDMMMNRMWNVCVFWGTFGRLTAENDGRSGSHDAEEGSVDRVFGAEGRHYEGWVVRCVVSWLGGKRMEKISLAGWLDTECAVTVGC